MKTRTQVLLEIAADMQSDVARLDRAPFDGRTLGEIHGNLAAAVCALASIILTLIPGGES